MRRVFVLALTALLLLATGGDASAGDAKRATEPPGGMPPDDRLEATLAQWLEEGDDLHAAWAGWIVAERRLGALAGAVAARLAREASGQGPRQMGFFHDAALLDALVRTGGTATGETLRKVAGAHIEAVTVLLCRRHAPEPAHLAVFRMVGRGVDYEAYVAIGNALAAWRVPAFTARILGGLEFRRRVRIWDEDGPYPPFCGPSSSVPGDGFFDVPAAYPPVATYQLSFERYAWGTWDRITHGPRWVYARRSVQRGRTLGFGGSGTSPDRRHEYRHEWLTALLEGAEVPALPVFATIDIKWTGGRQPWIRKTTKAVATLHEDFRAWRDALHVRGLLTEEALRTLRPTVELNVVDKRRYPRGPLPPFPETPFEPKVPEHRPPSVRGDV